ncbi:DUF3037 domain-containing protein, partial [Salmonella sp. SAL4447]|uniref:DUF3037 domain-containing protein n=1 Tax=Salmonella sp. SAL4447 TaxID=3159902 RepID=UPI00397DCCC4
MGGRSAFSYAVLRVVPSVERGEAINAGVVLYARQHGFLAARVALDETKLKAIAPQADAAKVRDHLGAIERIAAGTDGGPIGAME